MFIGVKVIRLWEMMEVIFHSLKKRADMTLLVSGCYSHHLRDIVINVHMSYCKVPVVLFRV
jgi:hypothetical protein